MEKINLPEIPKSKLEPAYKILGVKTPLELHAAYSAEDQRLMKNGEWDYNNPNLITNKVKEILEDIEVSTLHEEEADWRNNILWFWNHHAISCAIWKYKDQQAAQKFSEEALKFQSEDHPNQITRLLYFLTHEKLDQAEKCASEIIDQVEKETGKYLIETYKKGGFYVEQLPPK